MNEAKYREAEKIIWDAVGLTPREQHIHLNCTGTSARVQVVGDGEPVLFVHGGPNAGSTWVPMLEHFHGYKCFLIDRPGTGLSEDYVATGEVLTSYADAFVSETLDGLEIDRAHVVASSFGGYLALRSAAATPERFNRMVQMACPAFAPGMKTPSFMKMMRFRFLRWLIGKLPPSHKSNINIMKQIGHGASIDANRIPQIFFDWYLALQKYTNTVKNEFAMIGSGVSGRGFDPSLTISKDVFAAVETPTHFLWGTDDGFGGEDVAQATVSHMPRASLEMIPESGHLPWLDAPAMIAEKTAGFLTLA